MNNYERKLKFWNKIKMSLEVYSWMRGIGLGFFKNNNSLICRFVNVFLEWDRIKHQFYFCISVFIDVNAEETWRRKWKSWVTAMSFKFFNSIEVIFQKLSSDLLKLFSREKQNQRREKHLPCSDLLLNYSLWKFWGSMKMKKKKKNDIKTLNCIFFNWLKMLCFPANGKS